MKLAEASRQADTDDLIAELVSALDIATNLCLFTEGNWDKLRDSGIWADVGEPSPGTAIGMYAKVWRAWKKGDDYLQSIDRGTDETPKEVS